MLCITDKTVQKTMQERFSAGNLFLASWPLGWNSWTVAMIQLWVTAISHNDRQHYQPAADEVKAWSQITYYQYHIQDHIGIIFL